MSTHLTTPSLPAGFETLSDLDNMDCERLKKQPLVNIFGVISAYQPPRETRTSDWKCFIEIKDNTYPPPGNSIGMRVDFFAPRESLPQVKENGVIKMEKVKVQIRNGRLGLLTNRVTRYCILPAADLESASISKAKVITTAHQYQISVADMAFATWLYQHIKEDGAFPSAQVFEPQSKGFGAAREKYKQLKDVAVDEWSDIVVEVLRMHEYDGRMTIYVSDYTANSNFFDQKYVRVEPEVGGRDGDEFGYTSGFVRAPENSWSGPYGKLSLQLTLFDEHVRWASQVAKVGKWVVIKNVQFRFGRNGQNLEGFVRGGRGGIMAIEKPETREAADPRYLEGLRRRKEYEEKFKKMEDGGDTANPRGKRKAEPRAKARKRRRLETELAAQKAAEEKLALQMAANKRTALNEWVKCNNPDQPIRILSECLDPKIYISKEEGITKPLPFVNRKFRTNARVVDFFPDRLEDFVVGRVVSDYDILSDDENRELTDSEDEGSGLPQNKEWNWQFALKLEGEDVPDETKPKGRLWAVVDNSDAQFLLGLDADNLKENGELLTKLRRQLEILWGDLEERKLAVLKKTEELDSTTPKHTGASMETGNYHQPSRNSTAALCSEENTRNTTSLRGKNQPPTNRDADIQVAATQSETKESVLQAFQRDPQVKNKAFTCCIREFGVKSTTTGRMEDRRFGIFETRICGD